MSFLQKNLPSPNDLLHLMFTSQTIVDSFDYGDISSAVGSVGPSACAGTWALTLSRRASSPHQIRNACRQWARSPVFEPFCLLRAAATCAESRVVSKPLHCTGDRMCHKTRVLQGWSRDTGDKVLQERASVCDGRCMAWGLLSPESWTEDAEQHWTGHLVRPSRDMACSWYLGLCFVSGPLATRKYFFQRRFERLPL